MSIQAAHLLSTDPRPSESDANGVPSRTATFRHMLGAYLKLIDASNQDTRKSAQLFAEDSMRVWGRNVGLSDLPDDKQACLECIQQALTERVSNPSVSDCLNAVYASFSAPSSAEPSSAEPERKKRKTPAGTQARPTPTLDELSTAFNGVLVEEINNITRCPPHDTNAIRTAQNGLLDAVLDWCVTNGVWKRADVKQACLHLILVALVNNSDIVEEYRKNHVVSAECLPIRSVAMYLRITYNGLKLKKPSPKRVIDCKQGWTDEEYRLAQSEVYNVSYVQHPTQMKPLPLRKAPTSDSEDGCSTVSTGRGRYANHKRQYEDHVDSDSDDLITPPSAAALQQAREQPAPESPRARVVEAVAWKYSGGRLVATVYNNGTVKRS